MWEAAHAVATLIRLVLFMWVTWRVIDAEAHEMTPAWLQKTLFLMLLAL